MQKTVTVTQLAAAIKQLREDCQTDEELAASFDLCDATEEGEAIEHFANQVFARIPNESYGGTD